MFVPRLRPLKVIQFMQNEPQFILKRVQRTNVNIRKWTVVGYLQHQYQTDKPCHVELYTIL